MSMEATNPTDQAPANQQDAGAGGGEQPGSQYRTGMLVSVPHPGIQEDQPGEGPEAGGQAPGPERPGQEPARANQEGEREGEDHGQPEAGEVKPYRVLPYRGRHVPVKDEAELERLASQGLDYTTKTQMLAPHLADMRALAALRADPAKAAQLNALLSGQPLPEAGGAPGQPATPAPAKLPVIYVRDQLGNVVHGEDGKPVQADPTFVHAIKDYVDGLGLERQGGPAPMAPELAGLVTQAQVARVADYVKQTYGREDFTAAIPMIQEAMVAQGIRAGDARDNPDTWLSIYHHLALTSRLTTAGAAPAPQGQAPGGQPTSKRANKSETKAAAQTATPSTARDRGKDLDAAIKRAMEQGGSQVWREAVGLAVHHPDLEQGD